MNIKKYGYFLLIATALASTRRTQAVTFNDLKNFTTSLCNPSLNILKKYSVHVGSSMYDFVQKQKIITYSILGTALGVTCYKLFYNYKILKLEQKIQEVEPFNKIYFISPSTFIQEGSYEHPETGEKVIFLNIHTDNEFVQQVKINKVNKTVLYNFRSQHITYLKSLPFYKKLFGIIKA